MSESNGKAVAVATQANALVDAGPSRSVSQEETLKILWSNMNGTGRTEYGLEFGRIATERLTSLKSNDARKKSIKDLSVSLTGHISDGEKVMTWLVLYHVSLRLPCIRQLTVTWASLVKSSTSAGWDWKNSCDNLSSLTLDRLQIVLPQLIAGEDNLGCDSKGKASRKEWSKVLRTQVLGKKPVQPKAKKLPDPAEYAAFIVDTASGSAVAQEWAIAFMSALETLIA